MSTKLTLSDGWATSTSWRRGQSSRSAKNPITDAEWLVRVGDGDRHRVLFTIEAGDLVANCDCDGWHYDGWCAHVAKLWWDWSRRRLIVTDQQTGKNHRSPPVWLDVTDQTAKK